MEVEAFYLPGGRWCLSDKKQVKTQLVPRVWFEDWMESRICASWDSWVSLNQHEDYLNCLKLLEAFEQDPRFLSIETCCVSTIWTHEHCDWHICSTQGCRHRRTSLQYELWKVACINRSGRGYRYSVRSVLIFQCGKAREFLDQQQTFWPDPRVTRSILKLRAWCTENTTKL